MILLIYTIFTVIAGSGGDSSDDDEKPTIDINALNAEILNEDDEIHQMQNGTIDDVIAAGKTTIQILLLMLILPSIIIMATTIHQEMAVMV